MPETPCQKCKRERDQALAAYDAEVIGRRNEVGKLHAELGRLRVARENDAQRWKAAVEREHARAEAAEDRVRELEPLIDRAMALLAEAGPALAEGAKALRAVVALRGVPYASKR